MNLPSKPRTARAHGHWWGASAEDWAAVQEPTARPAYEAVLAKAGVGAGTRVCDLGCGAGLAAALAGGLGARVSGLDAAEPLLAIARRRLPDGDFHLGEIEHPRIDGSRWRLVANKKQEARPRTSAASVPASIARGWMRRYSSTTARRRRSFSGCGFKGC